MDKILTVKEAIDISEKLRKQGKRIVLAGGCFDILHIGHIHFLKEAKKQGDVLIVLLESDRKIRELKGKTRPINTHKDRACLLSALSHVDYIVLLPYLASDQKYDELILSIKPAIIATTKGDPYKKHKIRQANRLQSRVVEVTDRIKNKSTTRLTKLLSEML